MADSGATSLAGLAEIADIGRDRKRGGYSRHLFDDADRELREWFVERATRIGLGVERDRNGNLWAWWGAPGPNALVTGSHLDSVPGGGAFDGPLGVVSALDAVERLVRGGVRPDRPVAVVVFAEEEGSRFGFACLGSKLVAGQLSPERARGLTDASGRTLAEVAAGAGLDLAHLGRDDEALGRIGLFVELHVEQGRGLIHRDAPVGLAASILGHGRWRLTFHGQGNHAGATLMSDRRDPMVAASALVAGIPGVAAAYPGSRATVGRVTATPGGVNVIASSVDVMLDARAECDDTTRALVAAIGELAEQCAADQGCTAELVEESWTGGVRFDTGVSTALSGALGGVPALASGAGHDAGVLAASVPTAMLFVRNPTGISHAPEEFAEAADCAAGVDALEAVLRSQLGGER
ncbi:allantoate amidohydrolase [Gryllotalpicola reticulitermitis]|uniref:Allantoate amidohydrolase n=1 Tax=Gryllotalpicola reticulitermitis TaxID=1184153 RepID=A0ABV8Q646_9MICO